MNFEIERSVEECKFSDTVRYSSSLNCIRLDAKPAAYR